MNDIIKVTIEIPKKSNIKYEFNRKTNQIEVDRILRDGFKYPANYGFIKETLDWDGDELDVLVYTSETFYPGVVINAKILGAMKMIDCSETDTKLIAIHSDDYRLSNINELEDLPKRFLKEIKEFFENYKNWKGKELVKILGFENQKWAIKEYQECKELMDKYGHLSKDEFIKKMKELHPNKYI